MAKVTQSMVSKKNPFWIPKNRYYELKYFCFQFWDWQRRRLELDGIATKYNREPTESEALERYELQTRIDMVMNALVASTYKTTNTTELDMRLEKIILDGVTKGYSYDYMSNRKIMPVGRDLYYVVYRKFFYHLDIARK